LFPIGGCVYSAGDVTLTDTIFLECSVDTASGTKYSEGGAVFAVGDVLVSNSYFVYNGVIANTAASGGGIFAGGSVTVLGSTLSGNFAEAGPNYYAKGGAIFAAKGLITLESTISGNEAVAGSGAFSYGGGAFLKGGGDVSFKYSTLSGNTASCNSAFEVKNSGSGSYVVSVVESTISSNIATGRQTAGTYLPTSITNSTIAFNNANSAVSDAPVGFYSGATITMQSSIFANNVAKTVSTPGAEYDVDSNVGLTGAGNLIVGTNNTVPLGTLSTSPRLGPLAFNGGPTQTHALLKLSPAINAGNKLDPDTNDQRGSGFPRSVGGAPDIGAYELQAGVTPDRIFSAEFEGRCD
jgi:hypothetical protein